MSRNSNNIPLFEGVDRVAVILYLLLVISGLTCITSVSFEEATITDFFSFSRFHIKQASWACIALVTALCILLLDSRYYHMYAYYAYAIGVLLITGTIILPEALAPTLNGAKAWYSFGSFVVQPVEFTKITVALAVARLMSNYNYSIKKLGDLVHVGFIILLPLIIIILQNDTGSGIVLCSFIFVLYREGLNKWICIPAILVAALFICSFLFTPLFLLMILVLIFTFSNAMMIGQWKAHIIFLAAIALCSFSLYGISNLFSDGALSGYASLVITVIAAAIFAVIYAFRKNISAIFLSVGWFLHGSVDLWFFFHSSSLSFHKRLLRTYSGTCPKLEKRQMLYRPSKMTQPSRQRDPKWT